MLCRQSTQCLDLVYLSLWFLTLFLRLFFSCLSIYSFIFLSCSHVWLSPLSLISWFVIHIFEYLEDTVLLIFSSYTFLPNMFVLQHFQQEVSIFDMFRCLSYVQPIKKLFQLISDMFSYFQTFSVVHFIFQLFSVIHLIFQLFPDIFSYSFHISAISRYVQFFISYFSYFQTFSLIHFIFQLFPDIFTFSFHISAIFRYFQTLSLINFIFQLFSAIFSY